VGKIERLCKAPYELQNPFCFIGRIRITILLRTTTLSSDAVPFSSVTICCTLFKYQLEVCNDELVTIGMLLHRRLIGSGFILVCKENVVLWVLKNDYEIEIFIKLLVRRLVTKWEETKGVNL
jgi:hypothetical protein